MAGVMGTTTSLAEAREHFGVQEWPDRPRGVPLAVRILRRVEQDGDCWSWQGAVHDGYGRLALSECAASYLLNLNDRRVFAYNAMYELLVGPIPAGMQLDHLCRNRRCVRPACLEPVTPAENARRSESLPARNARKTRCAQGHEFTPENTRMRDRAWGGQERVCRICASPGYRAKAG